jgi:putative endonuclease
VATTTPKSAGDHAETLALEHLQRHGLALVCRNYRLARGPHARGGEIDLLLRDRDGTLVFVEVRSRASSTFGGALASVTARKQQRIVLAARHYLAKLGHAPPCRFDVVAIEGARVQWARAAFDAT